MDSSLPHGCTLTALCIAVVKERDSLKESDWLQVTQVNSTTQWQGEPRFPNCQPDNLFEGCLSHPWRWTSSVFFLSECWKTHVQWHSFLENKDRIVLLSLLTSSQTDCCNVLYMTSPFKALQQLPPMKNAIGYGQSTSVFLNRTSQNSAGSCKSTADL